MYSGSYYLWDKSQVSCRQLAKSTENHRLQVIGNLTPLGCLGVKMYAMAMNMVHGNFNICTWSVSIQKQFCLYLSHLHEPFCKLWWNSWLSTGENSIRFQHKGLLLLPMYSCLSIPIHRITPKKHWAIPEPWSTRLQIFHAGNEYLMPPLPVLKTPNHLKSASSCKLKPHASISKSPLLLFSFHFSSLV